MEDSRVVWPMIIPSQSEGGMGILDTESHTAGQGSHAWLLTRRVQMEDSPAGWSVSLQTIAWRRSALFSMLDFYREKDLLRCLLSVFGAKTPRVAGGD